MQHSIRGKARDDQERQTVLDEFTREAQEPGYGYGTGIESPVSL